MLVSPKDCPHFLSLEAQAFLHLLSTLFTGTFESVEANMRYLLLPGITTILIMVIVFLMQMHWSPMPW